MDRVEYQMLQLLFACCLGLSLGLFYDFYRLWLHKGRKKSGQTVGDILWWAFALVWTFFWLLMLNWAELRFLIVAMIIVGLALYIFCFSPVLLPIFTKLCQVVGKILRFFHHIIMKILWLLFTPIVALSTLGYKTGVGTGRFFCKAGRKGKRLKNKAKAKHLVEKSKRKTKREAKVVAKTKVKEIAENAKLAKAEAKKTAKTAKMDSTKKKKAKKKPKE